MPHKVSTESLALSAFCVYAFCASDIALLTSQSSPKGLPPLNKSTKKRMRHNYELHPVK